MMIIILIYVYFLKFMATLKNLLVQSCIGVGITCFFANSSVAETEILLAEAPVSSTPIISNEDGEPESWNIHGQATYILQQKDNFNSTYNSTNSLLSRSEGNGLPSYTFSSTLFLGKRLWEGAEFYFNPEVFQGIPFSGQLVGLGAFQNGELQKGAFTSPVFYTARAFLRQSFNFSGDDEFIESSANQLAGKVSKNRLVLSYGKFASLDFFDQNTFSHDPRTQFQNFAIFSMGAYGYAADPKGFTFGAVAEWYQDNWTLRVARLALPQVPNTEQIDYSLATNYVDQIEVSRAHSIGNQPGAIRAILFQQHAYMGSYQDAIDMGIQTNASPDIVGIRKSGQRSWGYGLNFEQALTSDIGVFGRWSWNSGNTETQTLDISNSLSGGISIKGNAWGRPKDTLGIGYAISGISSSEIAYLQQGGMTAFIGDGALDYKKEEVIETFYSFNLAKNMHVTADYQRISNPAYNAARGPINFFGIRAHIEM